MKIGNHTFSEIMRHKRVQLAAGILVFLILLLTGMLHPRAGFILALIVCAFLMGACAYLDRKLSRMMMPDTVVQDYPTIRYQLMRELPYPYILIDENGRILWENRAFVRMIYTENARVHNIRFLFPELKNAEIVKLKDAQQHLQYKDRYYAADFREIRPSSGMTAGEDDFILAVIFSDESELQQINQKVNQQKLVIGNIYLDNYDELDGVIDDARLNLVIAHIDRKVTRYFSSYGGIVKKIERDKYFLALPQKNVEEMEHDHFSILDEIRDVKVANDQHITLSIGLGMDSEFSYEKSYENSRAAVEMALGRGGDQVAIKNGEDYTYFGGSAHSVTHTTKVKARVKAHALEELLMNTDTVLIMGHALPDLDAIGAAVGVYRIAVSKGKRAHIILNEVSSSIRPLVEHLKPVNSTGQMFIRGEEAVNLLSQNTLLIIVDTNRGSYTEAPELLQKTPGGLVVIDHHRKSSDSINGAVLDYVEPYASSACELVAELLQYISGKIVLKSEEADAMYAGIVMDTNSFINRTGVRTFEAAAYLRRCGSDTARVRKLFKENMDEYKARAEAVKRAEIYLDKFALSTCPSEGLESPTIAGAQAANELLDIRGVEASIVLTAYNGKIYLSARSIDSVNVQVIMERLGGGGHGTMAGAQMAGCTIQEAMDYVKITLSDMMKEGVI